MMMTSKDVSAMIARYFLNVLRARARPSHHHHHRVFDQPLERADQFGAERAVDGAVIAGERRAHDVRGLDLAVSYHRSLLAGADCKDRRLRRVDNGSEMADAEHAEVGDRRCAAL